LDKGSKTKTGNAMKVGIMRKIIKAALALAAAGVMAATPVAASAATSSAHIRPNTYSTCDQGTYATLCFLVTGSGSYVGYMQDTVTWTGLYSGTHLEINGPSGTWNTPAGTSISSFRETFNGNVAPGSYCGTAWYYVDGQYYQAAHSCVTVNP
jgi:hypothetical protein